jgi:hypothetical protein
MVPKKEGRLFREEEQAGWSSNSFVSISRSTAPHHEPLNLEVLICVRRAWLHHSLSVCRMDVG